MWRASRRNCDQRRTKSLKRPKWAIWVSETPKVGNCRLQNRRNTVYSMCTQQGTTRRHPAQCEAITGDGAAIFRHACGLGLEGIVSKRIGSRYVSGRTRAWLKSAQLALFSGHGAALGDPASISKRSEAIGPRLPWRIMTSKLKRGAAALFSFHLPAGCSGEESVAIAGAAAIITTATRQ